VQKTVNSISTFVRAAGEKTQILRKIFRKGDRWAVLRLPSRELRVFPSNICVTLGFLLQPSYFKSFILQKAGRSRFFGKRPVVRGVAMNPIDHPHGGGEGKTSGGRPSVSPWGILTKGYKTRAKNKKSLFILKSRHKMRKRKK